MTGEVACIRWKDEMPSLETLTPPTAVTAAAAAASAAAPSNSNQQDERVTVIITTSPTPSAPSTELISTVLLSFRRHCPALAACPVILVLDTFDRVMPEARLKKGHVTAEGAASYAAYKENAKKLLLTEYCGRHYQDDEPPLSVSRSEAEYGADAYAQQTNAVPLTITHTLDRRVTFVEPEQRLGFGLAVRSALRLAETPYVWVQQHDWSLVADIPLSPLLDLMQQQQHQDAEETAEIDENDNNRQVVMVPIKYVCFPSVRMVSYATSDHVMQFPALRALTNLHRQNFWSPHQQQREPSSESTAGFEPVKIPLTPLFFWHDKPHLAEAAHYLARVFPNRVAMPRGAFIEDTVGHRARAEMKDGQWRKWACWLYYPDDGKQLCVRHLKGRTWRGAEAEVARRLEWMRVDNVS